MGQSWKFLPKATFRCFGFALLSTTGKLGTAGDPIGIAPLPFTPDADCRTTAVGNACRGKLL